MNAAHLEAEIAVETTVASASDVASAAPTLRAITRAIGSVLQGKPDVIETALICMLAEGHLLLDDVPGVGKTLLAKAMAATMGGHWSRVQFTPDLQPTDITGVSIWQPLTSTFVFRPGPVFSNLVVCDEINRGPAKTQAALLEAMEEHAVTVDGQTYPLARPFFVIATQNPFEQEGTYNLPESQLDRFLVRSAVGYPDRDSEIELLIGGGADTTLQSLTSVTDTDTIAELVGLTRSIYIAPALQGYIADVVRATREHLDAALGASPRGGLALARATRAHAVLQGRAYATPDDVRAVVHRVLDHRILVRRLTRWNREASGAVIDDVTSHLRVPGTR